jgi:hypothetical protein
MSPMPETPDWVRAAFSERGSTPLG